MEVESTIQQEKVGPFVCACGWIKALETKFKVTVTNVAGNVKSLVHDDPRRVIHSLKVGLALTLVSMLYYSRSFYNSFGVSGMWAVLTVVVVFEFTVGGTLCKSLNRGSATLLAGALGVAAHHLASLFGDKGEPFVIGVLVFLLAAASTFTRFFPRVKARYDYGVMIFILTFSLVSVSGYRVEELVSLANQRLSTVMIGGLTCIVVSVCICPVWAGQDLHEIVASNIEKLALYLEGFGVEYFKRSEDGVKTIDKSYLEGYKFVLNSKATEESMANLATWEPRHGRFRFRHPWKQYLKIGVISRRCAYRIEALNGFINSRVQGQEEFQSIVQESCMKMLEESSKALKSLSSAIKTMTNPSPAIVHVENSKTALKDLKFALKEASLDHPNLLAIAPAATVASILIEIVKCVEELSDSIKELSIQTHFKSAEPDGSREKPQVLHCGSIKHVVDGDNEQITIVIHELLTDHSPEGRE